MQEVTLVFPTHLFKNHPAIQKDRPVYIFESPRYFTDFKFHKQKLVLHRASMQAYKKFLVSKKYDVTYIEFHENWEKILKDKHLHIVDLHDHRLEEVFVENCTFYDSPAFIGGKIEKKKKYLMANFYMRQRKDLDILMTGDQPVGGKWSFDSENRKKLPKDISLPDIPTYTNSFVQEAFEYVKKHFSDNPGNMKKFLYPTTFDEAQDAFTDFLQKRFKNFGTYEDAISSTEPFIFHSLLSPLINIGLITPQEIIERAEKENVPLNAKEGFIRQIIGWREFMLKMYHLEGENQRKSNFFEHKRKIPDSFYTAKTGIDPLDNVIQKAIDNAYCHHIERLMVLGNFMCLQEYDPHEIYRWFMEMFIDSYDWVMVSNVYAMSQYADGGKMTTKPYVSGSNYIKKMSNFSSGPWCDDWDDLYWNFIDKHQDTFSKNPRMRMMVSILKKKKAKDSYEKKKPRNLRIL